MSRFKNYTDFDNRVAGDATQVLDDVGVSAQLYRQVNASDDPGFNSELPEHSFLRNILVVLSPTSQNTNDIGRSIISYYDAVTQDNDIRAGDLLKYQGMTLRILHIDRSYKYQTNMRLEAI